MDNKFMKKITILDGAMGTELEKRGLHLPAPLWSAGILFSHAGLVQKIHRDYAEAGADVLTAATFRSSYYAFHKAGIKNPEDEARKSVMQAVHLAKSAAAPFPDILIAGSLAPTGDSYRADDFPGEKVARKNFIQLVQDLELAGVDILLLETFGRLDESRIALEAASQSRLPIWFSVILEKENKLPDGSSLTKVLELAKSFSVEAFLINCSLPDQIEAALPLVLNSGAASRYGAYPNAGLSDPFSDTALDACLSPTEFAEILLSWHKAGLTVLGGCCGSGPQHIAELTRQIKGEKHENHNKN
jgi:S-methylmethionine-dependent homocysteine/selenocysteine methylase